MDCSLPGSSVHGIFQARVLEWVAIAFSTLPGTWVFIQQATISTEEGCSECEGPHCGPPELLRGEEMLRTPVGGLRLAWISYDLEPRSRQASAAS